MPLDYNPIGDDGRRTCEFIRASLSRVGVQIDIRSADLSAFPRVYTDREFDMTYNGHSNLFDPFGVQRIYWSKNFKKGVPFSVPTTTTPRSMRCRRRRGQEDR